MKRGLLLGITLCCLASCAPLVLFGAGSAAGVAGYKYYQGALTVIYKASYMETWEASMAGLERLNLQILDQKHDLTAGKIKARRADSKPVYVSLRYKSSQETEVVIRVGYLGNRDASMLIKEEIRKALLED